MESEFLDQEYDELAKREITVSELVKLCRNLINETLPENLWILGELSNVNKYPSGHVYMTLKDANAEISSIMYASDAYKLTKFPNEGEAVAVYGKPTIYLNKGRFQLTIKDIKIQGQGKLYEEFLKLKEDLKNKGWFDPEIKKEIPNLPKKIGVVVSTQGAAWRDIKITLNKRFPQVPILAINAPAQGPTAASLIASSITQLDKSDCEVILVCRGGGSIEDLWAYNEIAVAKAIYQAKTPIISGVGHETDETICDYVADLRAATPTAAAVAAIISKDDLLERLNSYAQTINHEVLNLVNEHESQLNFISNDLLSTAKEFISNAQYDLFQSQSKMMLYIKDKSKSLSYDLISHANKLQTTMQNLLNTNTSLDAICNRIKTAINNSVTYKEQKLNSIFHQINQLSPQRTLERGYAIVTQNNKVATKLKNLKLDTDATINFADGSVEAKVTNTTNKHNIDLDLHNDDFFSN